MKIKTHHTSRYPAAVLMCLVFGIVLIIVSAFLITGSFFWFGGDISLYQLSETLITAMLGTASLLIGTTFIIVGIALYKLDHHK